MSLTSFSYLGTFKSLLISLHHLVQWWHHVAANYFKHVRELNSFFAPFMTLIDFSFHPSFISNFVTSQYYEI